MSSERLVESMKNHLKGVSFASPRGEVLACCATVGLSAFNMHERLVCKTKEDHKPLIEAAVRILNDRAEEYERVGKSLMIATINTKQLLAEKALEQAGFVSTGWATRNPNRSDYRTKVKVYVKHLYTPEEEL